MILPLVNRLLWLSFQEWREWCQWPHQDHCLLWMSLVCCRFHLFSIVIIYLFIFQNIFIFNFLLLIFTRPRNVYKWWCVYCYGNCKIHNKHNRLFHAFRYSLLPYIQVNHRSQSSILSYELPWGKQRKWFKRSY